MKQRGSAILIAVLLVAAVGSAAFGIGRLFLMDAGVADKYESAVIAYYAAESGIEEGLLRYRYNKNQEVPISNNMPIVNLTGNNIESGNPASYAFAPLNRYYVPSVEYLSEFYGEDTDNNGNFLATDVANSDYPEIFRVPKDEAIKLDLSKLDIPGGRDITLYVKYMNLGVDTAFSFDSCGTKCPFMEVALTGTGQTIEDFQSKIALVEQNHVNLFDSDDYIHKPTNSGVITYQNLVAGIRNKNNDQIFDTPNNNLSITIRPLYADAIIGIKATGTDPGKKVLPAPYNTIKSTGHYGGVTRTLQAKIDRQAGTVFDLFDFVLYKES